MVALYSVRRIDSSLSPSAAAGGAMVEKERRTSGDSSASTERVRSAAWASRDVGRGRSIVLFEKEGKELVGKTF